MATINITLKPFITPNYAVVAETETEKLGEGKNLAVPLEFISDDDFHRMVETWVSDMYVKAKKSRPASPA
jgi:hypothetical protein